MSVYIGKVRPDGTVLFITLLSAKHYYDNARLLKRFYTLEHRLDALLELGTLHLLRPSPYGKSSSKADPVHCRAEYRDEYESKKQNLPLEAHSKESAARMTGYFFLWENEAWYILSKDRCVPIDEYDPGEENDAGFLEGLELRELQATGELGNADTASVCKWADIQTLADSRKSSYFLYRNKKLIARFEPKTPNE